MYTFFNVLLDSELSMKHHVTKLAAVCHYHLRRLRQIRRRVGMETTTRLVLAMITSRQGFVVFGAQAA